MERDFAQFLLSKTRQDYNLIAKEFSRKREKPWPEIEFLVNDYLRPGDKVLDLGCGNGRLLEFLKNKEVDYIGVDNSEKLIEIAKSKYPKNRFLVAEGLSLPFPKNYFDKIYSIAVFHHLPSKEFRLLFLKEAKRVLKPAGLLILTVWSLRLRAFWGLFLKYTFLKLIGLSKLDFGDVFYPWKNSQGKIIISRYLHFFTKKELKKLIKEAGLRLKEIKELKRGKGNYNIYLIAEKVS